MMINLLMAIVVLTVSFVRGVCDPLTATIAPNVASQAHSYQVNNLNTVGAYQMTAFTLSDPLCTVTYKLQLWDDLNADTVQDANEYLDVAQTAEIASGSMFFKASNADLDFHINRLMPVTNNEVGVYYLRGVAEITGGASSFVQITFTIVKNCDIETLTPPASISNMLYTFNAPANSIILAATTSSNPTHCPVTHELEVKDPTAFIVLSSSSFTTLISFD